MLKFVKGQRPDGTPGVRAVRIPAYIPVNEANRMCNTLGGQFSPATPLNPQKQLLREKPCVKHIYTWVDEFEMPFEEVKLADWSTSKKNDLPDSAFAIILPGGVKDSTGRTKPRSLRKLPYKSADGTVNKAHLRNALARVNQIDAPAALKRRALAKLLRIARAYGIKTQEASKFKLSDLIFFLDILTEFEAEEEMKDATSNTK